MNIFILSPELQGTKFNFIAKVNNYSRIDSYSVFATSSWSINTEIAGCFLEIIHHILLHIQNKLKGRKHYNKLIKSWQKNEFSDSGDFDFFLKNEPESLKDDHFEKFKWCLHC